MKGGREFIRTLLTCGVVNKREGKREVPQWTKGNFEYNWIGILVITIPPLIVLAGILMRVPFTFVSLSAIVFWGIFNGMFGVTGCYHRLYSHRCYRAHILFRLFGAFAGAGALEGSIKWWARNHRAHHRYVDTDEDPYDARRGFIFTHCGWFVMRMDYDLLGKVDVSDLKADPVVRIQRDYFVPIAALSGILLPWFACWVCGDWYGGFFYGVFLKIFLVHQFSFFINSLVHTDWLGAKQTYSDKFTPHDSVLFALVTFGEGYHNFHHEFPNDYRNGYKWYHLDPTKWYLAVCHELRLCSGLVRTPDDVIERSYYTLQRKRGLESAEKAQAELEKIENNVSDVMTWKEVAQYVAAGRKLVVIEDYVIDLDKTVYRKGDRLDADQHVPWIDAHPGGKEVLKPFVGKDATVAFNGGGHTHMDGARSMLHTLRVAHLKKKP